jgi:hypothetical protein
MYCLGLAFKRKVKVWWEGERERGRQREREEVK